MENIEIPAEQMETQSEETFNSAVETEPEYKRVKHKVRSDGQELEVPYDELIKGYNLEKVSRKRLEEAAKARDEAFSYIDGAKKEGIKFLKNHIPEDELIKQAYEILQQSVEYAELPEEQKEIRALRRQLDDYKKQKDDEEKTIAQKRKEQEDAQAADWLDLKMSETVDNLKKKYGSIVGTGIANEIARHLQAYELSVEDGEDSEFPDINAISEKVWNKWQRSTFDYLRSLPIDVLKKELSKDQLKSMRKMDLDDALSSLPQTRKTTSQESSKNSHPKQYKSFDDQFDDVIKQRTRGL